MTIDSRPPANRPHQGGPRDFRLLKQDPASAIRSTLTEERWEASWCGMLPRLRPAVLALKGHGMKRQEIRTVKNRLKQLNVELTEFKEELLNARLKELEQSIQARRQRTIAENARYGNLD